MICQNCHHEVADDLIFCTDCGARLHQTLSHTPTVLINDSVVTKISAAQPKKSPKVLPLVIGALLVVAVAGSFIAYRLFSGGKNNQVVSNSVEKPATRNTTANKPNTNSNGSAANISTNISNVAANSANTNLPVAENSPAGEKVEIWNEQIEIAPGEHYAVPFKLDADSRVTGTVKVVRGESIEGYIYLQTQFDEHFPDPTYKVSGTEGKEIDWDQVLVTGDYVLAFINKTPQPVILQGKFYTADRK